jgi:hypothetical protein
MFSMGTALDKSGAAALISRDLLHPLASFGHVTVLAGYYLLSMLLAQAMSGAATAVILAPIALSAANQIGVSPYPLLMTVILGTSSAFLTPVSHPANVLVMGPGGYKFTENAYPVDFGSGPTFHRALGLATHTEEHPAYDTLYRTDENGLWVHASPSDPEDPEGGLLCG